MKVTIVDNDVSFPPTSGKRLRTLNLAIQLADRHQITYIGRRTVPSIDIKSAGEYFRDHDIEPIFVDHPIPSRQSVLFPLRLAGNFFSPLPYPAAAHCSNAMREAVQKHATEQEVELWQFEWPPYMSTLNGSENRAPRLLIAPNVDTLIWERYYSTAKGRLKRWVLKQQWQKMERLERALFRQADSVVAVSDEDALLLRAQFRTENVHVVENGVDWDYYQQIERRRREEQIVFVGAMDYQPNMDAVEILLERIFPKIHATLPSAELHIVGRRPPKGLPERIATAPGVKLHADVPDVRPHLAVSTVMAVPLRVGGGSRLKILEALACGLPVVSTRVGAEGLRLQAGEHFIAAEEDQMADALISVLRNPRHATDMAATGREVVRSDYDWSAISGKLEMVWEECVAHRFEAAAT